MDFFDVFFTTITSFWINITRIFEIRHLIDIGLLSFVIYKLLTMLRTTSSGRVFRGISVLVVGLYLSSIMHLYATNYLLSTVMEWGLVVLVVLFQPEIRRFLERVGSGKLGISFFSSGAMESTSEVELAIKETVAACAQLSKDTTGVLMVFEGYDFLDDILETGFHLDCRMSCDLLKNIFWNKAPMHDGAVIVRSGRILGAACVLPLTTKSTLSKALGTRHRAGVGMSERADCLVVIVSEETGDISVAEGGVLFRKVTVETLEKRLCNKLLTSEEEEKRNSTLSGLFQKNKKEGVS